MSIARTCPGLIPYPHSLTPRSSVSRKAFAFGGRQLWRSSGKNIDPALGTPTWVIGCWKRVQEAGCIVVRSRVFLLGLSRKSASVDLKTIVCRLFHAGGACCTKEFRRHEEPTLNSLGSAFGTISQAWRLRIVFSDIA